MKNLKQHHYAEYVHCATHNLNLVLNDSVKNVPGISAFYDLINAIYVYFSESLPRWQQLNIEMKENDKCVIKKTLKKLCPTRWSSRFDSLIAIRYNLSTVMS